MPNNENIKLWVAALRSGDYKQGKGRLQEVNPRGERTYCCLGVASDLFIKEKGKLSWVQDEGNTEVYCEGPESYDGALLPRVVREWLGVKASDPKFGEHSAVYYNDGGQYTFDQIADLIEKEYLLETEEDITYRSIRVPGRSIEGKV